MIRNGRRLLAPASVLSRRVSPVSGVVARGLGCRLNAPATRVCAAVAQSPYRGVVHNARGLSSASGSTWEMAVPSMGDSISEGTVIEWLKQPGDWVDADEAVAVIETDKVSVDVRAADAGIVKELLAAVDDVVEVGAPLIVFEQGEKPEGAGDSAPAPQAAPAEAEKAAPKAAEPAPAQPAPAAAKSPAAPKPAEKAKPPRPEGEVGPIPAEAAPDTPTGTRNERRIKMTRMRARIADRLKDSQNTAAMLTTFQEVDMSALIGLRKEYKEQFAKTHDVKLGFMSAFMKASASALQEIPAVNAVIDGGDIVYRDYVDISVAVSAPRGLVVPVVRNVESMGFAQIEKTLGALAVKAREDAITLEDMAGGTFTVSNGGVFGSMMGTPIINPPQSAILGMHATKMRPVVVESGAIEARPIMYLALTYDHRLIDGREAVTFLCSVRDKVEDPRRLLLGL